MGKMASMVKRHMKLPLNMVIKEQKMTGCFRWLEILAKKGNRHTRLPLITGMLEQRKSGWNL